MLQVKNGIILYYSILISGFFFLDKSSHRGLMYIGIPLLLYFLYQNRKAITREVFHLPLIAATAAYALFTGLSSLWSSPYDLEHLFDEGRLLIIFPIVLLPLMIAHKRIDNFWNYCLSAFVGVGVLTAIILLVLRAPDMAQGIRMQGFNHIQNPVSCGIFYGLVFLILLFCRNSLTIPKIRNHYVYGLITLAPLLVLFLTQARGPLLVMLMLVFATPIFQKKFSIKHAACFVLFAAALVIGLHYLSMLAVDGTAIARGASGRFEIWQHALELIAQKPVIGHGIATEFMYPYTVGDYHGLMASPHSAYLGALVHTGAVGFVLQMLALGIAAYIAILHQPDRQNPATIILLTYGALISLLDLTSYYKNLDITWVLFWVPIMLIAVRSSSAREKA